MLGANSASASRMLAVRCLQLPRPHIEARCWTVTLHTKASSAGGWWYADRHLPICYRLQLPRPCAAAGSMGLARPAIGQMLDAVKLVAVVIALHTGSRLGSSPISAGTRTAGKAESPQRHSH